MRNLQRILCALTVGGLAVLAGAAEAGAGHHIKTVFIVLMENHDWTGDDTSIEGKKKAHYINDVLVPMESPSQSSPATTRIGPTNAPGGLRPIWRKYRGNSG